MGAWIEIPDTPGLEVSDIILEASRKYLEVYKCRCDKRNLHNSPEGFAAMLISSYLDPKIPEKGHISYETFVNSELAEKYAVAAILTHYEASTDHTNATSVDGMPMREYVRKILLTWMEEFTRPKT